MLGGHLVVDALLAEGVNVVFGIPGSHVLAIYDALGNAPQIRHVTAAHESNAALMAEAYSRVSGRTGVVIITAGPGATNAVTGIAQAYTTATPVVIITGSVPLDAKRETFHGVDDPTFLSHMFSPITKRSLRARCPEDIPDTIATAFFKARSGRPGPVHVEIDDRVLTAKLEVAPRYRAIPQQPPEIDTATLDRIVEMLRQAGRPVIIAGKGVLASFAKRELAQLAEIVAAPVVFPVDATGVMSYSNPWCVGAIATVMGVNPFAASLVSEADVLLGIGLRPNAANLDAVLRNASGDLIFIGFDDEQVLQEKSTISYVADTKAVIQELVHRLQPHRRVADQKILAAIEANKRTILETFRAATAPYRERIPLHIGSVLEELARHIRADTIVVGDVGNHGVWGVAYLVRLGVDNFLPVGTWGAMGYAIPGAIGAKIACPQRQVVGITGDGSFLMSSADFATAVQHRLDIVYVILKDKRFGMVEMLQRRDYGRTYATEIQPPDFVKYAESFGALGIRVERISDLSEAFHWAFKSEGPAIVEVISEPAVPYVSLPSSG